MTWEYVLRIFVAALLGGLIGLEREYRAKEAGFRTHFLVALGSALFMIVSAYGFEDVVSITWYIMHDWLTNFSYRIALSPWIFIVSGFTCFIISLLTVLIQSWRAASENPVNNIKTE